MQDTVQTHDGEVPIDTVAAAQVAGTSTYYIVKHSSGGVKPIIPFFKLGNRLRFWPSDLKAFLTARTKKG
jgi:hypothetical protein